MADITASMVKELRARTQAGMAACKDALVEAGADMEKAVEIILKKGLVKAADRAGRIAAEGEVATWVSPDGKRGVIVEVNCQTDFVSRGDDFKSFVKNVLVVASTAPKGADLGTLKYPGSDATVEATRAAMVGKTGENTVLRRWGALEAREPNGFIHAYVHGGKYAVIVHAEGPDAKNPDLRGFVDSVAMQICSMGPLVVSKEQITKAQVDKQKEIFGAQMKEEHAAGTLKAPEAAWPKIMDGKVAKWFTEVTLLGQDCVWDPAAGTIDKLRLELGKKLGGEVKIHGFLRYALGEGIEKKVEDLAAEVAKTIEG
jgi:elongation factor Ts